MILEWYYTFIVQF